MSTYLDVNTCYSLLSSIIRPNDLVKKAKEFGYQAIGIADKDVMFGVLEFYNACKKHDIKPMIGLQTEFNFKEKVVPALLYAKNNDGYKELLKLSSWKCANEKLNFSVLKSVHDCFVILYGEAGIFEALLIQEDYDSIRKLFQEFAEFEVSFMIGISSNDSNFWRSRNQMLKSIASEFNIKPIALPKLSYLNQDDLQATRVVQAIHSGIQLNDKNLVINTNNYFRKVDEWTQLFDSEELKTVEEMMAHCDIDLQIEKAKLPKFVNEHDVSSKEYLKELCQAGLLKRFEGSPIPKKYKERLEFEITTITEMNFEDYFLIVWDIIRFARKAGQYVGPGRGSSAGSLVAYVLGITHIDPIKYGLLFERFLNPERKTMPDIDIDFPDNRREEIIEYVYNRYGSEHVAHILTFGTFGAKQAIRDVGRVFGLTVPEVDRISKAIPFAVSISLEKALQESTRLKTLINDNQRFQACFEMAKRIEGLPRHLSTHAAGIVLSSLALSEIVPTIQIEDNMVSTQYSMEYLEALGLIKMDFLGLRNLTIIDEIVKNTDDTVNILKIPLNDQKTFELIRRVETSGIFQLESDGMRSLLRKMQAEIFEDIVVTIALFRPGPMENINPYLEARHNLKKIQYPHPDLEPILKETYGIMIYQEQIMQVAQKMAGFSLAKADILRKAMSKKNETEMNQLESEFLEGCLTKGYTSELAKKVFSLIQRFANYGFNKSHSVAYALISYQMAYLKANYPLQFFASLLSSVIGGERKTSEYTTEARRNNISVLSPDIRCSKQEYFIQEDALIFPLLGIKNVGHAAVAEILSEREENGEYDSFYGFIARINTRRISKRVIESLIDAGALDCFQLNRASMRASLEEALAYAELIKIEKNGVSQIDFNLVSEPVPYSIKEDEKIKLEKEKEVLGFFLSDHPIYRLKKEMQFDGDIISTISIGKERIRLFGYIHRVKTHRTKKGDMMAFLNFADESGEMDVVVMPNLYQRYQEFLNRNQFLLLEAKRDKMNSYVVQLIEVSQNE